MLNKKGVTEHAILYIVIGLIVLYVIIRLGYNTFSVIGSKSGGIGCSLSASFNSIVNIKGLTPAKLHCPRHLVTVVLTKKEADDLSKKKKDESYLYVDNPIPPEKLKDVTNWYDMHWKRASLLNPDLEPIGRDYFTGTKNKPNLYEYRLNEIMADEMRSCWNQLGRGEGRFISDWQSPINPRKSEIDGSFKDIAGGIATVALVRGVTGKFSLGGVVGGAIAGAVLVNSDFDFSMTKSACVVCSRVNFDEKIPNNLKYTEQSPITSLPRWMQVHPVEIIAKKPSSYYEFLMDDSLPKNFYEASQDARYFYSTEKSYAVIYQRIRTALPIGILNKAIIKGVQILDKDKDGKEGETFDADTVSLVPYEKLYEECPPKYVIN